MKTIKEIYKNVGASILPQFVNIVSNFILPVMIVSIYGSSINGLVLSVKTIISYISLVGAGISVATTQALYAPVAKGNSYEVKGLLKATSNMFNNCGIVYIIIVILTSAIYPLCIKGNISYLTVFGLLLVMSVSGASEFFVVGRCRSLLYADRKVYICTTIQALSLLISLIIAIIMLKLKVSIVAVQFGISFVYILRAFFLQLYVRKHYPQYLYDKETIPIQRAVQKRNDAMIHQLSGLIVLGSQSIILSSMVSLEAASIFAIYNIVFSGLFSICSNINTAITPFIGKSIAINTKEKVLSDFITVEYVFFLITSFVYMVCSVTILPFIQLYTSKADINYVYPIFAVLFICTYLLNNFRLPHMALINAAGHFKETRNRALIEAGICFFASIIFTKMCGMYGVLIGTSIAIGWRCLDMIIYSRKNILTSNLTLPIFRLFRCIVYIGGAYLISNKLSINANNYRQWIVVTIISAIVVGCILVIDTLLFERSQLKKIRNIIKR